LNPPESGRRLTLFGGPEIGGPQGPIHLSPFQMALTVLVYAEGSISRPRVSRLLWRREADSRTRQSIRQLHLGISKRLGESIFASQGDILSAQSSVRCDLHDHRDALETGSLWDASVYLSRGFATTPLAGLSDEFEDWREGFSRTLVDNLRLAIAAKGEVTARAGDWIGARDAAEAMYLLAPRDLEATARVIETRARVGKIHLAEAAFAEYEARGQRSDEVDQLMDRVRRLRGENSEQPEAIEAAFVGRRDTLSELSEVLGRVDCPLRGTTFRSSGLAPRRKSSQSVRVHMFTCLCERIIPRHSISQHYSNSNKKRPSAIRRGGALQQYHFS
jgi:DNA-binding SARP family transcriptional activator